MGNMEILGFDALSAQARGRWKGLDIHWRVAPKDWRAHVNAIIDPEEREAADAYLRPLVRFLNNKRRGFR